MKYGMWLDEWFRIAFFQKFQRFSAVFSVEF